ncbi:stromal cell-derived factor 2-like isoform X1 [Odontomachus brunneus]|uniref:stromal cell-derived factor 2-like isoform X1 n=1 Tax=Odontomachus brunneus TaxID=486640 RepID=UPI0013F25968|nr:stromal cell-derived factor 2-like isoform X1 [Odontomachus brunneus]
MDYAMLRLFLLNFTILLLHINYIQAKGAHHVTCGSVIKLLNVDYNLRLHSHDVKYGTGSGQQSVTGIEAKDDNNSYWLIKAEFGKICTRGEPIKCDSIIRLEHSATKKNLHSHLVSSPLSGKQEVSAYGDKGEGDTGDNWVVICSNDFWGRDDTIVLKHIDTDTYLSVSGRVYGSPISGQMEIVGEYSPNSPHTQWKAMEGMFIHPTDFKAQHYHHTEL